MIGVLFIQYICGQSPSVNLKCREVQPMCGQEERRQRMGRREVCCGPERVCCGPGEPFRSRTGGKIGRKLYPAAHTPWAHPSAHYSGPLFYSTIFSYSSGPLFDSSLNGTILVSSHCCSPSIALLVRRLPTSSSVKTLSLVSST